MSKASYSDSSIDFNRNNSDISYGGSINIIFANSTIIE